MGTRSWTRFLKCKRNAVYNSQNLREVLSTVYRHWDGYPHGVGVSLCEFLLEHYGKLDLQQLINEYGQIQSDADQDFGNHYLCLENGIPTRNIEDGGVFGPGWDIEWIYDVHLFEEEVQEPEIVVMHGNPGQLKRKDSGAAFKGPLKEALEWCKHN